VNKSGNGPSSVSVIDVATLAEVNLIALTGSGPEGIAISPNGAYVYVVNRDSASVDVIETATDTVVASGLPAPSGPRDAAFTPDGSKVYVVGESDAVVLPGDPMTPPGLATVPNTSGRDVAVSADGQFAYVARGPSNGSVAVVDTATDAVVASINLLTGAAYGIDLCTDGRTAYVSNDGSELAIVDLVDQVQVATSIVGNKAKQVKVLQGP